MGAAARHPAATRQDGPFDGAKCVLALGRRVVVLRRDDRPGLPFAGHWDLPGGGREAGERARATLARELREETGFRLPARLRWRRRVRGRWIARAALPAAAAAQMRLGDEGSEIRAVSRPQLRRLGPFVPGLKEAALRRSDRPSRLPDR